MKTRTLAIALSAATVFLGGCSVDGAVSAYHGAVAGMSMKENVASAKSLQNIKPVFQGVDSVYVSATLNPSTKASADVTPVFTHAVAAALSSELEVMKVPTQVCTDRSACTGKVVSVQFIEGVRDDTLFNKVTMGGVLTGDLHFVEVASGEVLQNVPLSGANYADLADLSSTSLMAVLLKSFPTSDQAQIDALNQIKATTDENKDILKAS